MRRAWAKVMIMLAIAGVSIVHSTNATVVERTTLPNGRIAFVRSGNLWLWEAAKERQVTHTGKVSSPRFSSGGHYIAFTQDGALWVVSIASGGSWRIAEIVGVMSGVWSPTDTSWRSPQRKACSR